MKSASRSVAWEQIIPPATLLLISLFATGPLWGPGLVNTRGGGDSPFLLLRTHQLAANLRAGVFPARWMPDAAYGFGYPFFSYYACLPYYFAATFNLAGLGILTAIKLTQTLFLAGAALAMYGWAEAVLGHRPGAWLAAVAYTVAPFHLVNLYVRGDSLSEFAAFAFYPLILLGFDRLASQPSVRRSFFPALAYAGLIMTHNVSALIFSPFILLCAVFYIVRLGVRSEARPVRCALSACPLFGLAILLALLVSGWFWLPALAETEYVQLDAQTTGYFFYGNHFRWANLVQPRASFDYATEGDAASSFAMGLLQAILAGAGMLIVSFRSARCRVLRRVASPDANQYTALSPCSAKLGFGLLSLLLSTWLITPLSRPLWDRLPLLPMVQFPWRFLSVQAVFTALLTGSFVAYLRLPQQHLAWSSALALGSILTVAALIGLQPDYLPISSKDVNVERLQLYELFTGNIGSTVRHEYLPRWVKPRPFTGPSQLNPDSDPQAIAITGTLLGAERLDRRPTDQVWQVTAGSEGSSVAFPIYHWPGWQASVDGSPVEARPAAGSGYLSVSIPPGEHTVEIGLGRTPLRLVAEVMSLLTITAVLVVCFKAWKDGKREQNQGCKPVSTEGSRSTVRGRCVLVCWLPCVVLFSLLVALHPRVAATGDHDLTMDFETQPYLHHNPEGVSVHGRSLLSYTYGVSSAPTTDTVAPGQALQVTLNWRRDDPTSTNGAARDGKLRLVSPATVRHDEVPPLSEELILLTEQQTRPDGTSSTIITLAVPQRTAPGIHLLELTGEPPIYLRPIWITSDHVSLKEPVQAMFADGAIRLHCASAVQDRPDRLHIQMRWSAVEHVPSNYGLSLSLTDPAGNEWLHQAEDPGYDSQPGHGFLPTSLWPLHRVMDDDHLPPLIPGAPPGDAYQLKIALYSVSTLRSVGQHTRKIALAKVSTRSDPPVAARFGGELLLSRVDVPKDVWQGQDLSTTTYWSVAKRPSADYVVGWELQGAEQSITTTQPIAPGSMATDWPPGAWIAGRCAIYIPPTTTSGSYTLSLTLREEVGSRIVGRYTHATQVEIRARDRVWELPEMETNVGAQFGDMIELAGYDLRQGEERLHLTLHWRALTTPDRHYVFFVHLADPETGKPVSQVDAMPRGFTYPTGQWAPGEVISDEILISTEAVAAGNYALAVGWYDPDSNQRLQAVDNEGAPLAEDRLVLPTSVGVP